MEAQKAQDPAEEVPFNMALMFYISLSKLMERRDIAAITGDIHTWFRCSHRIYLRVRFKFSIDEKDTFDGRFKEAREYLATRVGSRSLAEQVNNIIGKNVTEILDDIDSELMVTMDKYKMIFPKIESKTLKDIAKRYGLDVG